VVRVLDEALDQHAVVAEGALGLGLTQLEALARLHHYKEGGAGSREQGAGSREQGAGSREQGAGSREQPEQE
jgi:hypothetical protein